MRNPYYQGPITDHFDGTRFFHPGLPSADKTLLDVLKWRWTEKRPHWPKHVPARSGVRPAQRVASLEITHIGHASYLLQVSGQNILVDPVWSERASPLTWAGPRRHNAPGVALEHLPSIDAVLVTHNHYDHMDTVTLSRLWRTHHPRFFTPLGNDAILRAAIPGVEVETGDWLDTFTLGEDLRITIVPSYHWSSRSLRDRRMALWGGFVLETGAGVLYCAGDTAYRDGAIFAEIGRRFGPPLIAILPIGAYAPRWFMETQHANPDEALAIANACGARQVLGIHWGTFELTDEPFGEPGERFAALVRQQGLDPACFRAALPGDVWRPT